MILVIKENCSLKIHYVDLDYQNDLVSKLVSN